MSLHSSFPGLIIGIVTECFHFLGKHPSFSHTYICVKNKGKTWKPIIRILLVNPTSTGAFFKLIFFQITYYFFLCKSFVISHVWWLLNFLPNFSVEFLVAIFSVITYEVFKHVHYCAPRVCGVCSIFFLECSQSN